MGVTNPCWLPLQTGVKVVAIVNIVLDLIAFIFYTTSAVGLVAFLNYPRRNQEEYDSTVLAAALIYAIVMIICSIAHIFLDIVLYRAAQQKNYSHCRTWFVVTAVWVALWFIMNAISGHAGLILVAIFVAYMTAYQLWVVFAFMDEVKRGEGVTQLGSNQENMRT